MADKYVFAPTSGHYKDNIMRFSADTDSTLVVGNVEVFGLAQRGCAKRMVQDAFTCDDRVQFEEIFIPSNTIGAANGWVVYLTHPDKDREILGTLYKLLPEKRPSRFKFTTLNLDPVECSYMELTVPAGAGLTREAAENGVGDIPLCAPLKIALIVDDKSHRGWLPYLFDRDIHPYEREAINRWFNTDEALCHISNSLKEKNG